MNQITTPSPDVLVPRSTRPLWPLSRMLDEGELAAEVVHERDGTALGLLTVGQLLARYPSEEARHWASDYVPLRRGQARWALPDGTTARARRPVDDTPNVDTPWGRAHAGWQYGPGLWFYATASHGGFRVGGVLRDLIPLDVQALTYRAQGLQGWYEEDEDAHIVALAFPEAFDAAVITRAEAALVGALYRQAARMLRQAVQTSTPGGSRPRWEEQLARLEARAEAVRRWNPPGLALVPARAV